MAGGWLNFELQKPDRLNFGRTAIPAAELSLQATLPAPTGTFSFFYGICLQRTVSGRWRTLTPQPRTWSFLDNAGLPLPVDVALKASASTQKALTSKIRWAVSQRLDEALSGRWGASTQEFLTQSIRWQTGAVLTDCISVRWNEGQTVDVPRSVRWNSGTPRPVSIAVVWNSGIPQPDTVSIQLHSGQRLLPTVSIRWDAAMRPPHGWRPLPYVPPLSGKAWGRLNFACLKPGYLNFGNPCFGNSNLLIDIRRSYRVLNQAGLIRVSDSADIPVSNLTVTLDWESWCWTLSATLLGRTAYETAPAAPGLVQATINGFVWQFIPDDLNYSRAFGTFGGQLTGRSRGSELATPFALARSYRESELRTAEQLAMQELPEGYTLDWQLPEWTVPGTTYQYENLTPMESITRIVKAAGGRLYPDPITKTLHAVPKWPQKPWAWSFVVDATLPSAYALKESLANQAGTAFEAIMVSGGVNNGVIALCKITGTGGETTAPSVVDTLITHLDAATPRAVQELADTWPMRRFTLELPLQARPAGAGLILPGTTMDFTDGLDGWRGLVTSVSITAGRDSIVQTLEIVSP